MLNLTSTSDLISVVTSVATNVMVHASYVDLNNGAVTPGRTNTAAITTAATTTVVASPAASTVRNIKYLSVANTSGAANTVTVRHTDGTNLVRIAQCILYAGDSLQYSDLNGWENYTSAAVKAVGAGIPLVINSLNSTTNKIALEDNGVVRGYIAANSTFPLISVNAASAAQVFTVDNNGNTIATGVATAASFKTAGSGALQWADSNALIYQTAAAGVVGVRTGTNTNDYYFTFDASGNFNVLNGGVTVAGKTQTSLLGVGATSSAWSGTVGADISLSGSISGNSSQTIIGTNTYYNGTNWIAKNANAGSAYSADNDGSHRWYSMASVAAGAVQNLVQTVYIDSGGNLNAVGGVASGTTAATHVGSFLSTGNNGWGGTNYHGFLQATNTFSSTSKYFRLNPSGGLEIVNSAYNSVIFGLDDSGNLNTYSGEITTTNITSSGGVFNGTLNANGSGVGLTVSSANSSLAKIALADAGIVRGYLAANSTAPLQVLNASGGNAFYVDQSGNGIFTGKASATSFITTSDGNLKEGWQVPNVDEIFDHLVSVETYGGFDWKTGGSSLGIKAQEFEDHAIFNRAVHINEKGVRGFEYGGAAMISAVALAKKIERLEKRLAELESAK